MSNILTELSFTVLGGLIIVGVTVVSVVKRRYAYYTSTKRNPNSGRTYDDLRVIYKNKKEE
jgi:hypothetical protein